MKIYVDFSLFSSIYLRHVDVSMFQGIVNVVVAHFSTVFQM